MKTTDELIKEKREFFRRSLNVKSFWITMLMLFLMGGTILIAGFLLYSTTVSREFLVSTWNQANAEAAVVEQADYRKKCDEILAIYDSIPEEERGDGTSDEYKAKFTSTVDGDFKSMQKAMKDLKSRNGPMNAFIVALDRKINRMIYLVDSDTNPETFCYPGTWEMYKHHQIEALIEGQDPSRVDEVMDVTGRVQAIFTDQPKYGPRATGGSTLYQTDRYTVMVCVDEKMDPMIASSKVFLIQYLILLVIVTLVTAWIGMRIIRKKIVSPINRMATAAEAYRKEDDDKLGSVKYFSDLDIHTGDEIENLAVTLKGMESDLYEYVTNLTRVTAERERIETELDLASRIQSHMLPNTFPPFPDRSEFDIYASMQPARNIGGDFYDFFMIDDDHLAIEIADVAGKGIPAALFMTATKVILSEKTKEGIPPSKVFESVNEAVCANDQDSMFVTVWLGILEISTGKITAANAGHEYPVLIHADGSVELFKDKHGLVLGGMSGMKYNDYEIRLSSGDRLFVYTDGLPEATSQSEGMFGTDRMIETIGASASGEGPNRLISFVNAAVEEFVGEDDRFDDLTMLCLEYRGSNNNS